MIYIPFMRPGLSFRLRNGCHFKFICPSHLWCPFRHTRAVPAPYSLYTDCTLTVLYWYSNSTVSVQLMYSKYEDDTVRIKK